MNTTTNIESHPVFAALSPEARKVIAENAPTTVVKADSSHRSFPRVAS